MSSLDEEEEEDIAEGIVLGSREGRGLEERNIMSGEDMAEKSEVVDADDVGD